MKRKRIVLLILSVAWPCFAKMDLPPVLNGGDEWERFAAQIRMLVPEVARGNKAIEVSGREGGVIDYVKKEQELVRKLKAMPEYMALANERPPLQVFTFRLSQPNGERTDPAARWKTYRDWYHARHPRTRSIEALRKELARWPKLNSPGFFSAFVGLLNDAQKSVLKDPDVRSRWRKLERILENISINTLRSHVKAEAFNLKPNFSWNQLKFVAGDIANLEDSLANTVQDLKPASAPEDAVWLIANDWESWLAPYNLSARDMAQLKALRSRLAKKFWDLNSDERTETVMRELVLRELPPYLAIYRGCVGQDCSTSHSWPFPYSPTERNWWVEDQSGQHLGYVSGAITMVDGRSNLYIRDVTGPEIRRGDISLIFRGFYLAKAFFGAETMTIMNKTFAAQNHFPDQVKEILEFGGGFMETVTQIFTDSWVRDAHLRPLQSGAYDDIDKHTNVRLMSPRGDELEGIRIERHPEAEEGHPKQSPHLSWSLLADAVRRRDADTLTTFNPGKGDWMPFVLTLLNEDRLAVDDYYRQLERSFAERGLPFSRNLVRKYEHVFMPGHFSAPDAFSNERGRKQSVRYLENLIWRLGGEATGYQIVSQNIATLEQDAHWLNSVQSIFERRGPEDISRLKGLWDAGFRFRNLRLSRHDFMWAFEVAKDPETAEWALYNMDGEQISTEGATILADKLNNEDESIPETLAEWAAKKILGQGGLAAVSETLTSEMVASMEMDDNPLTTVPLALAFIRDLPPTHHFYSQAIELLRQNRENDQLTPDYKRRIRGVLARLPNDGSCENLLRPRNRR